MKKNTIVIIGKPNVGKSTLFNRLIGQFKSIVSSVEGVTRDRIYGTFEWLTQSYEIIDTGGYIPKDITKLNDQVKLQAEIAKNQSDLILFMIDAKKDISSNDRILAQNILKSGKSYILVVNKLDNLDEQIKYFDHHELGLDTPVFISAESGRNVGELLDRVTDFFDENKDINPIENHDMSLAVIGMPNVGKSSFVNKILNENKSIVSDIAGTTRDSIDSYIKYFKNKIRLIDTAGLRRKTKINDAIEFYSIVRTNRTIDDCDVAAILIDASKGFHNQDKNIIKQVIDSGKGLIVIVNKWDLIANETISKDDFKDEMIYRLPTLRHYPIRFISIKNNYKVRSVLEQSIEVFDRRNIKMKTKLLNNVFAEIIREYPPPSTKGKEVSVKYITQIRNSPPLFGIYSNRPDLISKTYKKYLINQIRDRFNFEGVPINISFRKK